MKVLVKIVGVAGWTTLFDQAQGAAIFMPEYKGDIQWRDVESPGFGAESESFTPEGNAMANLPWSFGQTYTAVGGGTELQNATASIRQLATLLGGRKFHLQVIQDGETQFWPNCVVKSYNFNQSGAFVLHNFVFRTEMLTSTAPTT